jgi:hypothetical protein
MNRAVRVSHEYLVDLDRFTVRVRVLRRAGAGWWECETIPLGTRIVLGEESFRGDVAQSDTSMQSGTGVHRRANRASG